MCAGRLDESISLRLSEESMPPAYGLTGWCARVKRAVDIAVAAVGLVLLCPLMLAASAAIRLDSCGPVLFRQTRVGKGGRKFQLYKFRSMCRDAEKIRDSLRHMNEAEGPVFKIKSDPRITRVGHFMRRTSIDELPQLINVFKGEMSLVGPRPPLLEEVERYDQHTMGRLAVTPGLTCLWQISGRSNIAFDQWVELDLQYIKRQSLWLDTMILLRTIPAVLSGRGAQ